MTILTAGETNLLFYSLDFGSPRNAQYLESSIVRPKLLACDAFVFQRVLYERASFDWGPLVPVYPLPHGLSATADSASKFGLSPAQGDGEFQGFEGEGLGGVFHRPHHKPLFKQLQTDVYGA